MSGNPIVVGTDGSSTAAVAVDKAGELGMALRAPVHVVCVPAALETNQWPARISAQQIVTEASDRLQGQGVEVQTHLPKVQQGEGALALATVAAEENAQMLIVGNKGMTGVRRLLGGSLPNRVSHEARCDVMIVPTESRSLPPFSGQSVVVGTEDASTESRTLTEAIRLAKALGGELHIVAMSKRSDASESALAAAAAEADGEGVVVATHALEGNAADTLLDVADKHAAAVVVVSSRGMQTGEREWFGNVTDKISHAGKSSVLIVFTRGDGGGTSPGAG